MRFKVQGLSAKNYRWFWRAAYLLPLVWVVVAWAGAENLIVEKRLEKADVVFVLSGSAAFVERTGKAAEIFHSGRARKIVLTNDGGKGGWSRKENRNPFFWELAQAELIKQGVPTEAIEVLPERVESTRDEAILLAQKARDKDWQTIILVTSAYHTRRTLWVCERVLGKNQLQTRVGIESPAAGQQTPFALIWWLSLTGWKTVAGEYLKFVYYWLFY